MSPKPTRRTVLATTAGLAGAATLTRYGAGTARAQRSADIYLGGATGAWEGRDPSSLEGTKNPTLTLREGETYELAWENVDGAPHNVAIEDENGDNLVESEIMSETGRIQIVEFTATTEMVSYYCVVHPGSMQGDVEIVPPDSSEGIDSDGDVSLPASPTPTPSPTPSPSPSPSPTLSPSPTPASTPTATATETSSPADGSGEDGPGFGFTAVIAALAAVAGLLRRRSD